MENVTTVNESLSRVLKQLHTVYLHLHCISSSTSMVIRKTVKLDIT